MKRVEKNENWTLFCPNEAHGLHELWGTSFEELYEKYEKMPNLVRKTIKAQELWFAIMDSQVRNKYKFKNSHLSLDRKRNSIHGRQYTFFQYLTFNVVIQRLCKQKE